MKEYEFNLGVFIFRDDDTNCYVAYCPSLELAGYADDEEGAKADFEFVFNEYLSYCDENGTLEEDLRRHGWEVKNKHVKPIPKHVISTILHAIGISKKEFETILQSY